MTENPTDNLWSRVESIFQDVFDDPRLTITAETTASDIPGWDSLMHINLVSAIERDFKIKFALGEIQELGNVGEMVTLIQSKIRKTANA